MPMNHDYPTHTLAAEMSMEETWFKALGNKEYKQQSHMFKAEEYSALLYDLGFKKQKVYLRVYDHILDSREGVIEWVKGTLLTHFQKNLPEPIYQLFLTDYRMRLFQKLPDKKPFFYPFKRLFIWAEK